MGVAETGGAPASVTTDVSLSLSLPNCKTAQGNSCPLLTASRTTRRGSSRVSSAPSAPRLWMSPATSQVYGSYHLALCRPRGHGTEQRCSPFLLNTLPSHVTGRRATP